MGKINDIQLCAQAVILVKEGYSQSVRARKLNSSKWWVTKWVGNGRDSDRLVNKERSGRQVKSSEVGLATKFPRLISY
jgi:transposase